MGYIYKIINTINNKMYIGKTELIDPLQRWKEHLKDYNKPRENKRPLYDAMNKYGVDNFIFEIIEETNNTSEREIYYINLYRTYIGFNDCKGYNATLGGDGKQYLFLLDDKIINWHINNGYVLKYTADFFNVDRKTIKKILVKNNITWLKHKEVQQFCSKDKNIVQLDKETREIINIFPSLSEANKYMNKKDNNWTIRDACTGRRPSHLAYNFLWYYIKDL